MEIKSVRIGVALALLYCGPVQAGHVFFEGETYLPTNSADGIKSDEASLNAALIGGGYAVSNSPSTSMAIGGRIGYVFQVSERIAAGPSLGYIRGPQTADTIHAAKALQSIMLSENWDSRFVRVMGETIIGKPRPEKLGVLLRFAIGAAFGSLSRETGSSCVGVACPATSNASANWSGVSWEIAPAVAYKGLLGGFRYAHFPSFGGTSSLSKMSWDTEGLFVGCEF